MIQSSDVHIKENSIACLSGAGLPHSIMIFPDIPIYLQF